MDEKLLRKAMRAAVRGSDGRRMIALERLFQAAAGDLALSSAITGALCDGTWSTMVREELGAGGGPKPAGCA